MMNDRDFFSSLNPFVSVALFCFALGITMFSMHPFVLTVSFAASLCYLIYLRGRKGVSFFTKACLPLILITMIVNPAFNHRGVTILCYLPSGNTLTLESILFGVSAAVMLCSVLMWFACLTDIMTSDKFIYITGRFMPVLSLLISMTLRFIPQFRKRFIEVNSSLKQSGVINEEKGKLKNAFTVFSSVVTWSLESAIVTADSMKSRGYGLKGRTAYSIYTFTDRDKNLLVFYFLAFVFYISGALSGNLRWSFYPNVTGTLFTPVSVSMTAVFILVCFSPVIFDAKEGRRWKNLKSAI